MHDEFCKEFYIKGLIKNGNSLKIGEGRSIKFGKKFNINITTVVSN
jgi:hypothetical protein